MGLEMELEEEGNPSSRGEKKGAVRSTFSIMPAMRESTFSLLLHTLIVIITQLSPKWAIIGRNRIKEREESTLSTKGANMRVLFLCILVFKICACGRANGLQHSAYVKCPYPCLFDAASTSTTASCHSVCRSLMCVSHHLVPGTTL